MRSKTIILNKKELKANFDNSIFTNISWSNEVFNSHEQITAVLQHKHPYTITILIETLNYKLRNNKKYVKKTRVPLTSNYRQLLYKEFFKEYGETEGNKMYGTWLEKYRALWQKKGENFDTIDDYIVEYKFEPRYRERIVGRFKNHSRLFSPRFRIERNRYYHLPEPLNHIDWRNPFDTIFVWEEKGRKVARRGGSGSSGARETNSMFIFGLLGVNKVQPVCSYLFLYSAENKLWYIRKFDRLCVPVFDIGSNYHLSFAEMEKIKVGGLFLKWDVIGKIKSVEVFAD